jgi:hypothetical protein
MVLKNGTRGLLCRSISVIPNEIAERLDVGRENRALDSFRENVRLGNTRKRGWRREWESLKQSPEIPMNTGVFQRNARDRNDLASSNFCRRLRLFARVRRFFYRDDTRNGTRRDPLGGCSYTDSHENTARRLYDPGLLRIHHFPPWQRPRRAFPQACRHVSRFRPDELRLYGP